MINCSVVPARAIWSWFDGFSRTNLHRRDAAVDLELSDPMCVQPQQTRGDQRRSEAPRGDRKAIVRRSEAIRDAIGGDQRLIRDAHQRGHQGPSGAIRGH